MLFTFYSFEIDRMFIPSADMVVSRCL